MTWGTVRHDVVAAVSFLEARHPGRPIVVMGVSLGSSAAVFAAPELGRRVQGYVLESPYRDLKTAVWNRTHAYLPPVLAELGYAGLRLAAPLVLPHFEAISPLLAIGGIPADVPVLIIAGANDLLARPAEARALLERVAGHGRLCLFSSMAITTCFHRPRIATGAWSSSLSVQSALATRPVMRQDPEVVCPAPGVESGLP